MGGGRTEGARAKESAPTQTKPNILVIWGDDIGTTNVSAYSDGLMGYTTPNIDRIANEGLRFLHYYGEQSCTAGRAAFLTGQHGIRTGLTKVGFPGAPMGMSQLDPSVGGLLKSLGYATGQFGKNHVGDRNDDAAHGQRVRRVLRQPLPPQRRGGAGAARLPEGPGVQGQVRARAACSSARRRDKDDPTEDPRFGKVGKQTIEDTGAAHQEADGDDRRRDLRRRHRLHEAAEGRRQAVLLLVERHRACTCART